VPKPRHPAGDGDRVRRWIDANPALAAQRAEFDKRLQRRWLEISTNSRFITYPGLTISRCSPAKIMPPWSPPPRLMPMD